MTSKESQQQQTSLTCAVSDLEGGLHSLTVEARTVLLDDTAADIVEVTAQQISFATEQGTIACTVDAFGQAVLGENAPTPGDLGQQLGQNLARWYAETCLIERLRSVLREVQGTLDEYERERPGLLLPQMRLDPYVAKVLESYKGTEESAQAIALVLDRPLEQIRALLAPAASIMRALASSNAEFLLKSVLPSRKTRRHRRQILLTLHTKPPKATHCLAGQRNQTRQEEQQRRSHIRKKRQRITHESTRTRRTRRRPIESGMPSAGSLNGSRN